jgi:hypothetical protein
VRPPEIEDRLMPGHWEGDLIKGKANASSVGTLVERTSGYLFMVKMNGATATTAMKGFSAALNRMPLAMRRIMTYDQWAGDCAARRNNPESRRGDSPFRPSSFLAARQPRKHQWPDPPVPAQGRVIAGARPRKTRRHRTANEYTFA